MGLNISQIIKLLRSKYDISQEELAFRCGMQSGHICKIEKGTHKPNIDTIDKIAKAFSMSIIDFLALDEEFLEVSEYDEITEKIIGISVGLEEKERLRLYKIAKTFTK